VEAAFRKEESIMATRIDNKAKMVVLAKQLIAGTEKRLTGTTQVPLRGSSFTPAELTAKLQSLVTLRDDVDAAKATTKAKLAAESADVPPVRTLMRAYVAYLKAVYDGSPDALADFGIFPKPRAALTVEAKAEAVAKRMATRAARHTMGTRQKKAVKGDVTGVLLTPISASAPTGPPKP
jgi:hypothetical protein